MTRSMLAAARAAWRRPMCAAALGACAAIALPHVYDAARTWWALRGALVVVDGQPITRADLERELRRRDLPAQSLTRTGRSVLDDMVELETLAAAARRAGYADDAEVRRDIKQALAGRYRAATIEGPVDEVAVGDDEVAAYYDANRPQFTLPEAARAAIVLFAVPSGAPEDRRRETMEKAEQARAEARSGGSEFARLAVRHSDDQASRYRGGEVGWLAKGQADSRLEPAVLDAVFALEQPGDIAPLVATGTGVHLVKLLEKKPERVEPLAKVRDDIRARLLRAKRAERERELRAQATAEVEVRVYETRIAELGLVEQEPETPGREAPAPWMAKR